jgi:hypothetical protein
MASGIAILLLIIVVLVVGGIALAVYGTGGWERWRGDDLDRWHGGDLERRR